MSTVDILAVGVWLLAGVGLALGYKARRLSPTDARRQRLGAVAVLLLTGPLIALLVGFRRYSVLVLATEYLLIGAIGVLILVASRRIDLQRYKLILLVVLGFTCICWSVWHIAGDFLLRRARIEGTIVDKHFETRNQTCTFCRADYSIVIGSRPYLATAEAYQAAEPGQRVRARFGRASRRILGLQMVK